jgi:TolB protein
MTTSAASAVPVLAVAGLLAMLACDATTTPPDEAPPLPDLVYWDVDAGVVVAARLAEPGVTIPIAEGQAPAWSPDGRRIAYATCCEPAGPGATDLPTGIVVVDPDGTGALRLTDRGDRPAWSPDGSRIAYVHRDFVGPSLRQELHAVALDGTAPVKLAELVVSPPWARPSWSPDGTRLAVGTNGIHIIEADGSGAALVTQGLAGEHQAAWSPDGSTILFAQLVDGNIELFTMLPDGSQMTRLTTGPPDYRHSVDAAWSPDGSRIAFARLPADEPVTGMYRLYVMSADGTGLMALADSARWPAWSPDGASIAYVRNRRVRVTDGANDIELGRGTWPAQWRPAATTP